MPQIDSYTKLLLHFDNNNIDSSTNPLTFGVGSTYSSSIQKFGGYSFQIGGLGEGAGITVINTDPNFSKLNLANTNFVIDFWYYSISGTGPTILEMENGGFDWEVRIAGSSNKIYFFNNGATGGAYLTDNTFSTETLVHIAIIRNGSNIYIAFNGTLSPLTEIDPIDTMVYGSQFLIGAQYYSGAVHSYNTLQGYLDELRISVGTDRGWTSNFTPPEVPYGSNDPIIFYPTATRQIIFYN